MAIVEYAAHDCKSGKKCTHDCEIPTGKDKPEEYIDKLRKMVQNSYDYVVWRQAILVALILLIPIVFFMYQRLPDLYEFFVITSIIFLAIYISSIWIWFHFIYPNGASIEKSLLELRDKITDVAPQSDWEDVFDFSSSNLLVISTKPELSDFKTIKISPFISSGSVL